jgi:hypothetical protein
MHSIARMILRLSSPGVPILLALLASRLATALSHSGFRNAQAASTDQGVRSGLPSPSDRLNSLPGTGHVLRSQPRSEVQLARTPRNDVRELRLSVSRLPGAKFPGRTGGPVPIDELSFLPQPAENTKQ